MVLAEGPEGFPEIRPGTPFSETMTPAEIQEHVKHALWTMVEATTTTCQSATIIDGEGGAVAVMWQLDAGGWATWTSVQMVAVCMTLFGDDFLEGALELTQRRAELPPVRLADT